ncbi:MAG: glucose-6-phosphate dehydrogenase [Betaproteobacteria bacterium]|nr:glucose-6-phosphate dehydrogenase [Betaproteobacteria bacterium]
MATEAKALQLVLFGATGDLAARLIVPALFNLHLDALLPERFALVATGREQRDAAALAHQYHADVVRFSRRGKPPTKPWADFARCLRYVQVEPADRTGLERLVHRLAEQDAQWRTRSERVYYLATPPDAFEPLARALDEAGLAHDRGGARIVVEKPLGRDLASSRDINRVLARGFEERQIYRIDHFLGKETVQNILAMRFANPIFEPVWDRRYIDHVVITVAETLGVAHRAGYYEQAGALRDMVQNHLLQLLCLVAMEPPVAYAADDIRDKKLEVLRAVRPFPRDRLHEYAVRGQYGGGWIEGREERAYRAEPKVDRQSRTETYCALKLFVDNWRWQGVPFYLRTGKRLPVKCSEISVRFRDVPHRAFDPSMGLNAEPTRVVIQIQPAEGIVLRFTAKEPGAVFRLRPVNMRFSYGEVFQKSSPDAYETLLWDIMHNDATLFMRADQVEAAWALLEPVLETWADREDPGFPNYAAGSWGPEAAELLVAREGHSWLTPITMPPAAPC